MRRGGHSALFKDTSKKRTRIKEEYDGGKKPLHDPHGLKLRCAAARAEKPVPRS
jgi:hypothetical protein